VVQELTDRTVSFHNRLIGRIFYISESKQWTHLTASGRTVNEKLHNHSPLVRALSEADRNGTHIELAVESVLSWEYLEQEAVDTAHLTKPLESSHYESFRSHYSQFRQYTPKLLETFRFDGIPVYQSLLAGVEALAG